MSKNTTKREQLKTNYTMIHLKKSLGLFTGFCLLTLLWACPKEVGGFQGKITFIEANTGNELPANNAEISLYNNGNINPTQIVETIIADADGSFYLEVYSSGEYQIVATYVSNDSTAYSNQTPALVSDGKTVNRLDMILSQ